MKTKIIISLLLLGTLLTFQNCKDCVGPSSTELIGKWQLEKIVTANSTIDKFDKPQYLRIDYITTLPTSGGKGYTEETVLEEDKVISTKIWDTNNENCKRKEMTVSFRDKTTRDYKLISDASIQVSNYNFIGSSAMPATYYYFRIQP